MAGPRRSAGIPQSYEDWNLLDDRTYQALTGRFKDASKLGIQISHQGDYLGKHHFDTEMTNALSSVNGSGRYAPKGPDIPHPSVKPRGPRPY